MARNFQTAFATEFNTEASQPLAAVGPHLSLSYEKVHRRSAPHHPTLHRIQAYAKRRAVPLSFVTVLHLLFASVLIVSMRRDPSITPPAPLQVRMLEQAGEMERPPPPPPVQIERPRIDAIMPDLPVFDSEPAPNAITVAVKPAAPAQAPQEPAPEVTLPKFDADYLSNPTPIYPAVSRRLREEGVVVLRVRVTAEGTAAAVQVDRTSGHSRLDTAAVDAVQKWRFVPARRGAAAVEAWVLVPVEFELRRS